MKKNQNVPSYYTGPTKFYAFILEKYRLTKEDFKKESEWTQNELRKEHKKLLSELQIETLEEKYWNSLTKEEQENQLEYENACALFMDMGLPSDTIEYIMHEMD